MAETTPDPSDGAPSLRTQVLRGGAYLTARQGVGTAINVVGVVLLTRTIGPSEYGIYAAASALLAALALSAQMGVGVFLVRSERGDDAFTYDVATTLLLVTGLGVLAVGGLSIPLFERWVRIEGLGPVTLAVCATLPLTNLTQVPLARLERRLDYRRVAGIELGGQVLYFAVALPLAVAGAGAWAPVGGLASQQAAVCVATHRAARHRPRLSWSRGLARDMVGYGAGFTGSLAVYQLRKLVNPLVVGRYLGADAVGVIAVTTQIVTHLSFVAVATFRLSMAALARVQGSTERLVRAVSEGMKLQVLAVAPFLVVFAWLAPVVVPPVLGPAWSGIMPIYPFLAVAALVNAMFNLHSSALYVLKWNGRMATFHAAQTGLLAVAALWLVPRLGVVGYGAAEMVALASYGVLHGFTTRSLGPLGYGWTPVVALAASLALFYAYLGPWSVGGLLVAAVVLRPWRGLPGLLAGLRGDAP